MTKNLLPQNSSDYFSFIRCPSHTFNVPQRVQRLLILEFAKKMGLTVGFYVPRLAYDGAFYFIEQKILEKTNSPGFIAYSIGMLDDLNMAVPFLENMVNSGYHMWFATEEIKIATKGDITKLFTHDKILKISRSNASNIGQFSKLCKL